MKRGRKSAWDTKIEPRLLEIAAWCRDGHTDKEICKALQIAISTFSRYKLAKKELKEALKVNKAIADITVENSLFKRANGYEFEEITKEIKTDIEGHVISRQVKQVQKQVAPDTKAIERWLMNRMPDKWRDLKSIEITGKDGKDLIPAEAVKKLSKEDMVKHYQDAVKS